MSTLVSITAPSRSPSLSAQAIHSLPVLVIFPHNQCNCRCMMCDIWRLREAREISSSDIEEQLSSFRKLGVGWVVFSGGEPQLNDQWSYLAQVFRTIGSRVTLLTAGLMLQPEARIIAESIDDVIVSLDGPPAVHNRIRRVANAFERMAKGVRALHELRPEMPVRARCTVQNANRLSLRAVTQFANEIGLRSISFLAADLTSTAFNHSEGWQPDRRDRVSLTSKETDELELEIERLIEEKQPLFESGFIVESPGKVRRIVQHFRAYLGQAQTSAPRCNAPWVSAVIEASGDVRPCFFHPVVGNIHRQSFTDIINGSAAMNFRASLDIASNPICRNCVCSLHLPKETVK